MPQLKRGVARVLDISLSVLIATVVLNEDPEPALRAARPRLSDEEIKALLAGDVGRLSKMGANHFLLHQLGRWQVLGLDLTLYAKRIRAAWR